MCTGICVLVSFVFNRSDQLITWWCLYCAGKVSRAQRAVGQSSWNLREKKQTLCLNSRMFHAGSAVVNLLG